MWHHKGIFASFAALVRDKKQPNVASEVSITKGSRTMPSINIYRTGDTWLFIRGHAANDSYGYIYFNGLAEFRGRFQTAAAAITCDVGEHRRGNAQGKKTGSNHLFVQVANIVECRNGPTGIDVTDESREQLASENLYPPFLKTGDVYFLTLLKTTMR